jgi:hypothetical protein
VLHRRLIDAQGGSGEGLPLFSPYGAEAQDVLLLWQSQVGNRRLSELLHAFALVHPWRKFNSMQLAEDRDGRRAGVGSQDDAGCADNAAEQDEADATDTKAEAWLARFESAAQLPRAYALLKLCFVGGGCLLDRTPCARAGNPMHLATFIF